MNFQQLPQTLRFQRCECMTRHGGGGIACEILGQPARSESCAAAGGVGGAAGGVSEASHDEHRRRWHAVHMTPSVRTRPSVRPHIGQGAFIFPRRNNHLQCGFSRTNTPKRRYKTNTFCPLTRPTRAPGPAQAARARTKPRDSSGIPGLGAETAGFEPARGYAPLPP